MQYKATHKAGLLYHVAADIIMHFFSMILNIELHSARFYVACSWWPADLHIKPQIFWPSDVLPLPSDEVFHLPLAASSNLHCVKLPGAALV